MLVAWMNGGMNGDNFTAAMLAMCLNLLLFMGVYGLSLIAVDAYRESNSYHIGCVSFSCIRAGSESDSGRI